MIEIAGFDRFEPIGQGGMAIVYKARQISIDRDVAIKVLSDPSPDADLIRRFERESRAVGALSWHPHIAAVVDAGATDHGQAFIVFELLQAGSLDDVIETHPMPWDQAIGFMIQTADAVEAAHRAEVLHRDIKPANILVSRLGEAKLADFGIASMQDGHKTATGTLAATVVHAAPELFDGAPASAATDVYALGSTLHTLVTGRPPFAPRDNEGIATVIRRIGTEAPPVPDPAVVPAPVAGVIAHALAKQPAYRLRTALSFGKALQQVQRDLGLAVTPMPVGDTDASPPPAAPDPATLTVAAPPPQPVAPAQPVPPVEPVPPVAPAAPVAPLAPVEPPRFGVDEFDLVGTPTPAAAPAAAPAKPFSRTIAVLTSIAILLAAAVGGLVIYRQTSGPELTTAGGAPVADFSALADTLIDDQPAEHALDQDERTYWGIEANIAAERNIAGTTFVIEFDEIVTVTAVGISNGTSTEFGRVSEIWWGTEFAALTTPTSADVRQQVPNAPGAHQASASITTKRLILLIADVHDVTAPTAGVAEILITVSES